MRRGIMQTKRKKSEHFISMLVLAALIMSLFGIFGTKIAHAEDKYLYVVGVQINDYPIGGKRFPVSFKNGNVVFSTDGISKVINGYWAEKGSDGTYYPLEEGYIAEAKEELYLRLNIGLKDPTYSFKPGEVKYTAFVEDPRFYGYAVNHELEVRDKSLMLTFKCVVGEADDVIDFDILDVVHPVAGETPQLDVGELFITHSDEVRVVHMDWKENVTGKFLKPTDTFKEDTVYVVHLAVVAKEGYKLSDKVKASVNGYDYQSLTHYGYEYPGNPDLRYYYHVTQVFYSLQNKNMIKKVEISGVKQPVAGEKPHRTISDLEWDSSKYKVVGYEWMDWETNKFLSPSDTFKENRKYGVYIAYEPIDGYKIDITKAKFSINGQSADYTSGNSASPALSGKLRTFAVMTAKAGFKNTITDVTLSGLPIALFDKTIKEAIGTPSVSSNGNVRISNLVYGNFRGHYMDDTEKFNTQDEYGLEVHLEATGNYGFANKSFNVEIDNASKNLGYELDTDLLDTIYLKDQKNAVIQLKLKPKSIVGIVDIRFPEAVLPVSGEKPTFDKAKFSAEGEFNVNVNRIRWEVSNRELSNSDTFTEGSKAILGVVIDPHDSVYNVVDSALGTKFTMNGDSATAIKKDGKVIVSKDYQVKKSDKKHDPKKPQQPQQPGQSGQPSGNQQYTMHFSDVMPSDWYYNYVKYVYEKGIMNGVGDGKFAPKNNVSRAMIVTMLYRIAKEPAVGGTTNFNDNTGNTWYTKAVKWTAQKGLAKDFIKGNFDPNVNLTREQMITIMYNYQKSRGKGVSTVSNLNDFKDGYQVSAYAQTPMKWAVKSGIIQGNEQKKINPQANVTRAEVAAIIQRFNELR